jgi:ribonuclease HI
MKPTNLTVYPDIEIFADGSCIGNGKRHAVGGVGVFFGEGDRRNVSKRYTERDVALLPFLDGVTNQTMELMAIWHALSRIVVEEELTRASRKRVIINTDSMYSIKCITVWSAQWKRNGWRTAGKDKPVQNRRLIEAILQLVQQTLAVFVHVRGHGTEPRDTHSRAWHMWRGNMRADALANGAARSCRS